MLVFKVNNKTRKIKDIATYRRDLILNATYMKYHICINRVTQVPKDWFVKVTNKKGEKVLSGHYGIDSPDKSDSMNDVIVICLDKIISISERSGNSAKRYDFSEKVLRML